MCRVSCIPVINDKYMKPVGKTVRLESKLKMEKMKFEKSQ